MSIARALATYCSSTEGCRGVRIGNWIARCLTFPLFFAFQRPGVMQLHPLPAEPRASLA